MLRCPLIQILLIYSHNYGNLFFSDQKIVAELCNETKFYFDINNS